MFEAALAKEAGASVQLLVNDERNSIVTAEHCAHELVDADDAPGPKRKKHTNADLSQPTKIIFNVHKLDSSCERIEQDHCTLHAC